MIDWSIDDWEALSQPPGRRRGERGWLRSKSETTIRGGRFEFEQERRRIASALGDVAIRIDHHGSTSVPGLAAKPVIDIQVSVRQLQPMDGYRAALASLGYVHVASADDDRCPFFHRPAAWPHTHHVHVVEADGLEERRTLAFRDYLRQHRAVAMDYLQLKRRLAEATESDDAEAREAYARGKSQFIELITERALAR